MFDLKSFDPTTLVVLAALNPAVIVVAFWMGLKADQWQKLIVAALASSLAGFFAALFCNIRRCDPCLQHWRRGGHRSFADYFRFVLGHCRLSSGQTPAATRAKPALNSINVGKRLECRHGDLRLGFARSGC